MGKTKRVAGLIQVTSDGVKLNAKGHFSWNLGLPIKSAIIGADSVHGTTEKPQTGYIEGKITVMPGMSVASMIAAEDVGIVLQTGIGPDGPTRVIGLSGGYFVGEGEVNTEESEMSVRWESDAVKEIPV